MHIEDQHRAGKREKKPRSRQFGCGLTGLAPAAGGAAAGIAGTGAAAFEAISFTTRAASFLLIGHEVSLIRHCASVNVHPQSQFSEFMRFSAAFFCSGFSPVKSTFGSSVASTAFFRNICPVSSNV